MKSRGDVVSILAVAGSLRSGSYNRAVVEAAARVAPPDAKITVFDGLAEVPVFDEDLEGREHLPEGVTRLRAAVAAADGLLISTPEYNQSVPGVVKNMIDWLSRGAIEESLEGRPVAVTGATTGPWGTRISQTLLKQMLLSVHALVMPAPMLFIPRVESLLDEEGRLVDPQTLTHLEDLVAALVEWTVRLGEPELRSGIGDSSYASIARR